MVNEGDTSKKKLTAPRVFSGYPIFARVIKKPLGTITTMSLSGKRNLNSPEGASEGDNDELTHLSDDTSNPGNDTSSSRLKNSRPKSTTSLIAKYVSASSNRVSCNQVKYDTHYKQPALHCRCVSKFPFPISLHPLWRNLQIAYESI